MKLDFILKLVKKFEITEEHFKLIGMELMKKKKMLVMVKENTIEPTVKINVFITLAPC